MAESMSNATESMGSKLPDYDMETAKKMHFVTSAIVGIIFVVVGVLGNILSIVVWSRPKMRSSTGTYLIGLAIADIGLLVFFFLQESIPMLHPAVHMSSVYGAYFVYIGYPIFFLFVICSIWFTVGVTVDRYLQVCWISEARKLCTVRQALVGLGIITLCCFVINVPHFATFETVTERNATDPAYRKTAFGVGKGSESYEFWVHCMFLVLVPVISIFSLNMLILKRVSNMNKDMVEKRSFHGKEKAKKSEAQLTRLLLTVTFTFIVLIAFQCIVQCFFMLQAGNHRIVSEAFSIAKLGIVINSSVNFFLYCLSGKRFRKELKVVLCSRFVREDGSSMFSLSHTSSSSFARTKSHKSSTADTDPSSVGVKL